MKRLRKILGMIVFLGAILMFGAAGSALLEALENIILIGDFHLFGAVVFNCLFWLGVAYVGFKILGDH